MATIRLSGDGQEFPLPDDVARSDELLRQALVPFYPEVAGADIKRENKNGELVVTVIRRAGTKGAPLPYLIAASEEINPALVMAWELKKLEAEGELELAGLMALQPRLERAIRQGEEEGRRVETALKELKASRPEPGGRGMPGF
jgi:hypothetical protein